MPIYEYECDGCGETLELLRSIATRDKLVKCLKLGCKGIVKRKMSVSNVKFRGSGFHATDYSKTGPKQ